MTDNHLDFDRVLQLMGGSNEDVLRAIALIDDAAAQGDPSALERRALFEAVGCCRQPSWDKALDTLREAAECGSQSAGDQLRILARAAEGDDWEAIRSSISVEQLISAPPKRVLSERPRLRIIKEFATIAECHWLSERARSRLRPATVVTLSGSQTVQAVRTNSAVEFQLIDMDVVLETIRARISAATKLPLPLFEPSQVLHYSAEQEFRPHHDYFEPENPGHSEQLTRGQRIATFLVYLNDDYRRGETSFPRVNIGFKGNAGDALFIANVERSGRPDPFTLHAGTAPMSGEKWILSQWIRDKPVTAPRQEQAARQ